MKTKSALSHAGSDAALAKQIGEYFRSCTHLTVPFVGGGSIFPFVQGKLWAACMKNCEWTCMDAFDLIPRVHDEAWAGLYLDPPWYQQGGMYLHKFTRQQHEKLPELLSRFTKAKILVRYDDCEFIRSLYRDWEITEKSARNQSNNAVREIWVTREGQP